MPGSSQQARLVRFGLYEADFAARELRRDGTKVKLQDRPFEVLTILLERPGEVVSREELRKRLWPADTFVDFDPSLNTSINKLRQALLDDAENPRFIATAGRRGYRFIAPVIVVNGANPTQVMPAIASVDAAAVTSVPARSGTWMGAALWISALAIVGVLAAIRLIPERTPKLINIVQISHNEHLDPWGRVTTDGARLFFLERAGGHWNVMQVPASGGEAQPFPVPSQNTRFVDVSPDRSEFLSFAFLSRSTDLPLSLTPVVGGPSRRVGDIVADDAVFGLDGRRIFFTKPDGIYSCDRNGTRVQKLVTLQARSENPRWSKDGRRLRFTLFDRGPNGSSIWEVSADGRNLHPVLANFDFPGRECCGEWSPDGRYFFFESVRDSLHSVWAIRESRPSWFARAPQPVQLTVGPRSYGSEIPDGNNSRLFVWGGTERLDLVRYNPKSQRAEPFLPALHSPVAALSSDASWVAFLSEGTLWKSRPDGSQRQSLTSGFSSLQAIQWSPDDSRILVRNASGAEFGKFLLIPSQGGPPSEVSFGSGNNEPTWVPDGQSIVYTKLSGDGGVSTGDSGIYLLDLRRSKTTKIPGSEGLVHASFSPDQRFLVAVTSSHLDPARSVMLRLLDTRTQKWKDIAQGTLLNPVAWSRDSKYVYYQDILGENEPVFRYAIGGTSPQLFSDFANLLHGGYIRCAFVRFAPDGEIVALLTRGESDLYRLDLDLP